MLAMAKPAMAWKKGFITGPNEGSWQFAGPPENTPIHAAIMAGHPAPKPLPGKIALTQMKVAFWHFAV